MFISKKLTLHFQIADLLEPEILMVLPHYFFLQWYQIETVFIQFFIYTFSVDNKTCL